MGRLNTWPFLSNLFCIISLQILFCSYDNTTYASATPSVARVSSSYVELENSDSDIFDTFFATLN